MPPETRKLITFANNSNPSPSFVNIKVSVSTGIYHQKTILNSSKLLHNIVLTHLGWIVWEATHVNEFIALMQRTGVIQELMTMNPYLGKYN